MGFRESGKPAFRGSFPRVYPILDTAHLRATGSNAVRMAQKLTKAGFQIAQYRHKGDFTRTRFEEAVAVGAVCREAGICYIVNDRADIAMAVGADGVHVGQEDLPVELVRRLVGEHLLVGYSTHNAEQLAAAECDWADYLAIGPVFATGSKLNPDPTVGPNGVRVARSLTGKPLVAIGGMDLGNIEEVFSAGADSVSVISALDVGNLQRWAIHA